MTTCEHHDVISMVSPRLRGTELKVLRAGPVNAINLVYVWTNSEVNFQPFQGSLKLSSVAASGVTLIGALRVF